MANIIGWLKVFCEQAQPIGLGIELMLGTYEILKYDYSDKSTINKKIHPFYILSNFFNHKSIDDNYCSNIKN
jgi:hypothetical protein